jgi:hypothetical protein
MVDMFTRISGIRNDETKIEVKALQKTVTEVMSLYHPMKEGINKYLQFSGKTAKPKIVNGFIAHYKFHCCSNVAERGKISKCHN